MDFAIVVCKRKHECPSSLDFSPVTNPIYLPRIINEVEIFKQVGGIGHAASQCVVVDPNFEQGQVESDCGIAQGSALECQEPWDPSDGAKKTAELDPDATTNLEGGK